MEEKRNLVPLIIGIIFVALVIFIGGMTNYKQETLICSTKQDSCVVERTNFFNMKSTKILAKFSEIEGISYFRQRIKGNRYAKGYQEYLLAFTLKNDYKLQIFTKSYYDKEELNVVIKKIRSELLKGKDFSIVRE